MSVDGRNGGVHLAHRVTVVATSWKGYMPGLGLTIKRLLCFSEPELQTFLGCLHKVIVVLVDDKAVPSIADRLRIEEGCEGNFDPRQGLVVVNMSFQVLDGVVVLTLRPGGFRRLE